MTISYSDSFFKLMLRWKGSLWKTIWVDLLFFLLLYYSTSMLYRFGMHAEQQKKFQRYIILFDSYTQQIPLTFLLGFYVAMVIRRWWDQFSLVSWPDQLLYLLSALLRGPQPIARHALLASVLAWRSISVRVLTRFPTDDHLLSSGLVTADELEVFKSIKVRVEPHGKWFVPLNWIQSTLIRCFESGKFTHTNELNRLLDALDSFREGLFRLFLYDWVTIPLVYTQVVTISVYGYFAMCLIGRQYPKPLDEQMTILVDIYVPVFTLLQFLFYVGWLKVGEDLIFPFGSDDEDLEFNYILDRNLEMAYLIVDDLHNQLPPGMAGEKRVNLLHTVGSSKLKLHCQKQHLRRFKLPAEDYILFSDYDPYKKAYENKKGRRRRDEKEDTRKISSPIGGTARKPTTLTSDGEEENEGEKKEEEEEEKKTFDIEEQNCVQIAVPTLLEQREQQQLFVADESVDEELSRKISQLTNISDTEEESPLFKHPNGSVFMPRRKSPPHIGRVQQTAFSVSHPPPAHARHHLHRNSQHHAAGASLFRLYNSHSSATFNRQSSFNRSNRSK